MEGAECNDDRVGIGEKPPHQRGSVRGTTRQYHPGFEERGRSDAHVVGFVEPGDQRGRVLLGEDDGDDCRCVDDQ